MSKHLPEPTQFCAKLADLHAKSVSPTGKFGFQVPAVQGIVAQKVDWNSSWASLFGTMLADLVQQDIAKNGPWPELEQAFEETRAIVIPRLLGVLETGGRTLKPCLIHGNMWEGNCGTELETGAVRIYDAGSFYAHNEMELGLWRSERIRLRSKAYMRQYLRNFGVSEPVDEFEDRIRCYSIKYNLAHSCHHAGSYVREKAFEDMCFLVAKYAPEMIHDDTEKE
ncbi:hypothetical protein MMC20_007228 [Loxospora ochrophaea]|nr:hypothetical protein [Loxospora ochrophaea]